MIAGRLLGVTDTDPIVLGGGVANPGAVVRIGDEVRRPARASTAAMHDVYRQLRSAGFDGVPEPLGIDDQGRERLRFIDGDVPVPPFPAWSLTTDVLASVGRLLRRYHDAVSAIPLDADAEWSDEVRDPEGGAVLCHNDVCPENVVFVEGEATALIDFDFAAPGRPVWDVAQTVRMWVPLVDPESAALAVYGRGGLDPFARLAAFCDAYGLSDEDRRVLPDVVIQAKETGIAFVNRHVAAGDPGFVKMFEEGGGLAYQERSLQWLHDNRERLAAAIAPA